MLLLRGVNMGEKEEKRRARGRFRRSVLYR